MQALPAFERQGGGYLICETYGDGRYKWVDPHAEMAAFFAADAEYAGNATKLTQIFKQWQRYCDVPIKSFHLEAMVKTVLPTLSYGGGNSEFWFDWYVRDVFASMTSWGNGSFAMPVTGEVIQLGDAWLSKTKTAAARAVKACDYEQANLNEEAGEEWQKIFGQMIPQLVT